MAATTASRLASSVSTHASKAMASGTKAYDFIIVGGGTAGCVLANRLSANPKVKVLLMEAGGSDRGLARLWVNIPVGYLASIGHPEIDWCYRTEKVPGLGGRSLRYPRGKILGGCSSINGMIYMRGQASDYDTWEALDNKGWGWEAVLPYFKRTEDWYAGADDVHGAGGEWRVEQQRLSWEILEAFRDACAEKGIPKVQDFSRGSGEGVAYFPVNQRKGLRWNTSKGFLHPITSSRPNLTVETGVYVTSLLLDGDSKRVKGVSFFREGDPGTVETAHAGLETILAAGAVGSAQIMQVSGLGPADVLKEAGVAVRRELPGVGQNLQDHLQLRMVYKVHNTTTLNDLYHSWPQCIIMALQYLLFRKGPLSMAPSQLGAFFRSDPSVEVTDLEFHVQPLSLDAFGSPLHKFSGITASVCHLRPESRGYINVRSPDPRVHPVIQPNYLSSPGDRRVAAAAIRRTREVLAATPLAPFKPEEYLPGAHLQSEEDLCRAAAEIGATIFHPVGTLKMGPPVDRLAVVDDSLRVHSMESLRVVDASIMPTITSGNTATPVVMIAEKASDMIHQQHGTGLH